MGSATSIIKLSLQSNQYEQGLRGAKRQFEDFTASIGINMKKMTAYGLAAGAAASAINGLTSAISEAVTEGTRMAKEIEGVRAAFKRLDQPDLLNNLREATHGTVNDLELMKQAVKFDNFNLSLDQMGTMLAFAQQQAKDTGQDVNYLVDSIVTGLGRKSLPILDNLGLSATEIRDRMKETGDMTKAVASIIEERMAAAGGYVETASDRAAKATVELENAMTSLGETFAPLVGASDSLWNSIKIGAINALNTAVRPLIQALAEAGALGQGARSSAGFNNLGGNSKVDRMIGQLGDGKSQGAYNIYKRQLAEFDKYIGNKRFQIAAYGNDKSGVAQSAKSRLQTELDGALKMRAEYVKRAQELHDKVPSPYEPTASGGGGGRSGGGGSTFNLDSIAFKAMDGVKADPDKYFQSVWEMIGESGRKQIAETMDKQWDYGKDISEKPKVKEEEKLSEQLSNLSGKIGGLAGGLSSITSGFKAFGIELPKEVDSLIGVISGVSQIISGVGTIIELFSTTSQTANTVALTANTTMMGGLIAALQVNAATNLLPFANGGLVPHAASGYMVPGNYYSGDVTPIMANAGELILNKSQQNNIASQLTQAGGGGRLVAKLKGRDILISLERELSETGKGQLATWR